MKMLRHYFISDNLDDLEVLEEQLEAAGVSLAQIHVLSAQDAEVHRHAHLHEVQSLSKSDIVWSTLRGAVLGVVLAAAVLLIAWWAGWTQTAAGWVPFVFLAIVVLGFCAWEGGLAGIQRPNHHFARFQQSLAEGKHVFFVDLEPEQERILQEVLQAHPQVVDAGTGESAPHWVISLERKIGVGMRHA